ncbi:hypothetical protein AVEN_233190-1, partial [Araneus ventricosus]
NHKNHPARHWHLVLHERPAAATDIQALWFLHYNPITSGSCDNPPPPRFSGVRPVFGYGS